MAAIKIRYRSRGEVVTESFSGKVRLATGEEISVAELPLRDGVFDLTRVPVVCIGGKKGGQQDNRLAEFRASAPDYKGVIFLLPYSWANGWSDGRLILSSRDVLSGQQRISGGRPEAQLANFRWLRDGRYVADRAELLHGKVIKTLQTEVEQEPGTDKMIEAVINGHFYCQFEHNLVRVVEAVCEEIRGLEHKRVMLSGEQARDARVLVRTVLNEKLREAGVRKVADIPERFSLSANDVVPELVAQVETLGTIEVPGLGRKELVGREHFFIGGCAVVEIPLADLTRVTDWPFTAVGIRVPELYDSRFFADYVERGELHDVLFVAGEGRWEKILSWFHQRWNYHQRRNIPADQEFCSPQEADPPPTPEPVVWGNDFLTGEQFMAYPALCMVHKGYKECWCFRWFDSPAKAAEAEKEWRHRVESYITARHLEAALTTGAKAELPVPIPSPYMKPTQPEEILAMAGFASDQYRIREDVGHWYSRGWSATRDEDGDWSSECPPSGSFARKGKDGVWEIGQSGLTHLLDGGQVGDWNRQASAPAVLAEMGVGEKIATIKVELESERETAEDAYRASVRAFARALQTMPAFASLSPDMQARLVSLASIDRGIPVIDEAKLRVEWGKAEALMVREDAGEVFANFSTWHRRGGATNQGDGWVVQKDGTFRDPDSRDVPRHKSDGTYCWRLVGPDELAITWSKAYTAAPHEFVIVKLPTRGCTPEQLAAVEGIERELAKTFDGSTGMSGTRSPGVGSGWGLKPKPEPKPAATPVAAPQDSKPVDLSKVDFGSLFGGNGRVNGRR